MGIEENKCASKEKAQELIAKSRNGSSSLVDAIFTAKEKWRFGSDEIAKEAIYQAVNKYKLEILRLAELDIQQQARGHKIKAKMLKEQLNNSIIISE